MISYIKGQIVICQPTNLIIEAGGIGYQVFISLQTYTEVSKLKEAKILTYYHVKEDGHSLYGFYTEEERYLFVHLISVNGVGPNTARLILSSMEPFMIKQAIILGDDLSFKRVKGIGPKTAQRIIIDLKDKLTKENQDMGQLKGAIVPVKQEALSALLALGFIRVQIEQGLKQIPDIEANEMSVEALIKLALKKLA
ncbi:MAG TPA: Holliday junction branch migration protein RuvA [Saprospiraceae bacterium]|nr:Holliday junction branch migration protein RuvA [Saprospiraceae bacterium]